MARRAWFAHRAIACCVLAAILLCSHIAVSFVGVFLALRVGWLLAALLIAAMVSLIAALAQFLAEVRLASRYLPFSDDP